MSDTASIRLSISDGTQLSGDDDASVAAINAAMRDFETYVEPLDLSGCPNQVTGILRKPKLAESETKLLMERFMLSRVQLLRLVKKTGRSPNVEGGGQLKVFDESHDYYYPNLWAVEAGIDYSRFDQLHINTDDSGVGVDEVGQLLFGGPFVSRHRSADGRELLLSLSCACPDSGWTIMYNGGTPHVGSLTSASIGTKVLVQVFGPPSFKMRYVE